ncbi:DUF4173 domain-containing protein [Leisingera aquaemixtae]|uniref:DUF4153 domain-containing protein n=1 Tax=Leisingera aquaemixtae TaxID=1396826 RepID=UPI001C973E49|nr:DUF4173 domain-containing protein [Leisingera aquaemixtae]MBY6068862.1 DUF4173 domain-containing protein [Leisingera aquaemixtae]
MRQELVIHGVPDSIRLDAWWLETAATPPPAQKGRRPAGGPLFASLRMRHAIPLLGALVALADWLFWDQPAGISFAVFALVLSAAILAMKPRRPTAREWAAALGFAVLSNLPAAIELQFLSVLFSLGGLACLAAWAVYGPAASERLALRTALRLPTIGAALLLRDAVRALPAAGLGSGLRGQAASLALPLLMGAVFLMLLAAANPLLEELLAELDPGRLFELQFWLRILFWTVMAALLWPCLNLSQAWLGSPARPAALQKAGPSRAAFLINPVSVRNSLLLFNLLFLVQTVMDLGILTGGVSLPKGMSYASYAHRGAYPLVVTALLAGVFTLATRSMIGADRALRALVYLWLAQNMFLVLTAAIRLHHYVGAYALTYLRVAAFIWMALVLAGLLLTVVQIHRGLGTAWLLRRCFAVLLATLYTCGFVNFAGLIASYNLTRASTLAGPDTYYICSLGAGAYPAIHAYETETGQQVCGSAMHYDLYKNTITNWREWGFRRWRIQAYYQQQN